MLATPRGSQETISKNFPSLSVSLVSTTVCKIFPYLVMNATPEPPGPPGLSEKKNTGWCIHTRVSQNSASISRIRHWNLCRIFRYRNCNSVALPIRAIMIHWDIKPSALEAVITGKKLKMPLGFNLECQPAFCY